MTSKTCDVDDGLRQTLRAYNQKLNSVDRLLLVHTTLQAAQADLRAKRFLCVIAHLQKLQQLMQSLAVDSEPELDAHKHLRIEMCLLRENLLYAIGESWDTLVQWTLPSKTQRAVTQTRTVTLDLSDASSNHDVMTCAVRAMVQLDVLQSRMSAFCDKLMQYIIQPVVQDNSVLMQIIQGSEHYLRVVSATSQVTGSNSKHLHHPLPAEVFQKLEQIFVYLHQSLGAVTLSEDSTADEKNCADNLLSSSEKTIDDNATDEFYEALCDAPADTDADCSSNELSKTCVETTSSSSESQQPKSADDEAIKSDQCSNNSVSLVRHIGSCLCRHLMECIYNDCLSHVIPRSTKQYETFNDIVASVEQFQTLLTELDFLGANETSLLDYLNNVNILFANVKSQEILRKASQKMTQELTQSVRISADNPLGLTATDENSQKKLAFVRECRQRAGTTSLKMPTCQVRSVNHVKPCSV